jgi:Ca-activated chloride channel family protein
MSFANPKAFLFLIFALATLFLVYFQTLRLQRRLSLWIDPSMWSKMIPTFSKRRFIQKQFLLVLGVFFMMLAMARPQWGEREERVETQGMDILFLLDLSNSMLAEDTPPSRLNRAQTFIKKSLEGLADDRVGIIGFAGRAILAVPLTTDFGYVADMTDTLSPTAIMNQGTNIGEAIDVGLKAFQRGAENDKKTSRAVILISDGEDFGADALKAAEKLKDFGAGFFAVSVGTSEGAPIPIRNDAGVLQTYKKDRQEKPILSRVNRDLLSKIATEGGGSFIELVNPDDASYALVKGLRTLNRDARKEQTQITRIDRFQWFVGFAVICFVLHLFSGYPLATVALLFVFHFPLNSQAQSFKSWMKSRDGEKHYKKGEFDESATIYNETRKMNPDSPVPAFNEATALSGAKKTEEAIPLFQEATKQALSDGDYETAAKSLYNEGLALAEQKNLKEAYDRLTKSIELSRISNQADLEKMGRQALSNLIEIQKQQKQQQKNKEDQGQNQNQDQKKPQQDEPKDEKKDDRKDKGKQPSDTGKRPEYKSGTLSKDVAESIMNDLSDREKQLNQHRMKERKSREVENEKDW